MTRLAKKIPKGDEKQKNGEKVLDGGVGNRGGGLWWHVAAAQWHYHGGGLDDEDVTEMSAFLNHYHFRDKKKVLNLEQNDVSEIQ